MSLSWAGSLVTLLISIYYSGTILFVGAEFTRASHGVQHAKPEPTQVPV